MNLLNNKIIRATQQIALTLLVSFLLVSCGGKNDPPPAPPTTTATTMTVIASGTVGAAGGVIADPQQETLVRVPPGAVTNDVLIEIRRGVDAEGHIVTDFVSSADTGAVEITLPDTALLAANMSAGTSVTANNSVMAAAAIASKCNPKTDHSCYPITEPADATNFSCDSAFNDGWFRRCAYFWVGHRMDNLTKFSPLVLGDSSRLVSKPASSLSSYCEFQNTICYEGKQPVLFIHGYTMFDALGGGEATFGAFPNLIMNAGYIPFEFRWSTDARFEDVARDLGVAVAQIARKTGMKVHIVAHSFGGVLARTYLQGLGGDFDTNKVVTLTTLGAPHSGLFDAASTIVEGVALPFGRDSQGLAAGSGLDACGQLSCYQMGADVNFLNGALFNAVKGKIAADLSKTDFSSAVHAQSLIGLTTCRGGGDSIVDEGDGLIKYQGQRFHPADTVYKNIANYYPLRHAEPFGLGWVSEAVLGAGDVDLKPGHANPFFAPARGGYTHNSPSDPLLCNGAILMVKPDSSGLVANTPSIEHQGWANVRDWLAAYPATLVVSKTMSITGKIQNAATGAPVEKALVKIKAGSHWSGFFTKPDGSFIANVDFKPYTKYSISIEATGYRNGEFVDLFTTAVTPNSFDTNSLQIMPVSTPPLSFDLIVDVGGTGGGSVTSTGIACPTDCMENLAPGTAVTLNAQAAVGSIFVGWSGCARTDKTACYLSMNSNMSVVANFAATATAGTPPPTCTLPQVLQNGVCVTPPVTTPTPPGIFTSFIGSAYCDTQPPSNTGAVQLNWASSGATSYEVFRDGIRLAGGITQASFKNNLIDLAGQTHSYFIRAHNSTTIATDSNTVAVSVPSNICQTTTPPPAPPPTTDTAPPTVDAFSVNASTATFGQPFIIAYSVSDSGGSGLKQISLWRANVSGAPNDSSWRQIGSAVSLSGNSYSNVFSDVPPAIGNYWYGIHVIDNANPAVVINEATPLAVTVSAATTPPPPTTPPIPVVSNVTPNTITQGTGSQSVTITGSNFTPSSYHQYSVSGGGSWAWATVAPAIISSTSMTITVANTTVQTMSYRVCGTYGNTATCSINKVDVTVLPPVVTPPPTGCTEAEPNDSSLNANPLTLNVGCAGKISTSTDKDWFDIYVNSGTTITFNLQVPAGLDYDLNLFGPTNTNSSQAILASSTNGAGQSENITYTTTATGYFAVQISGFQGANSASAYTITRSQ
jgi:pimeloyl-ACP methyl ester carboxylesterase